MSPCWVLGESSCGPEEKWARIQVAITGAENSAQTPGRGGGSVRGDEEKPGNEGDRMVEEFV